MQFMIAVAKYELQSVLPWLKLYGGFGLSLAEV